MALWRGEGFGIEARMGLVRFTAPGGGVELGVFYDGRVYELSSLGYTDAKEVFRDYEPEDFEKLVYKASRLNRGLPVAGVRLLAPLERPSKIILAGLNYYDHARELGMEPPHTPELFVKTANSIVGPGDPIVMYAGDKRLDGEAELAVVIGYAARSIDAEKAEEAIWGYMVLNDVSARTEQLMSGTSQWWRGKSHDTYCPIGPLVVPRSVLGSWRNHRITLIIGNEILQDSSTSNMIFTPEELVAHASRSTILEPGDIIATGTPAGVGHARRPPRYLRPSETIKACIGGIGCIENTVIIDNLEYK